MLISNKNKNNFPIRIKIKKLSKNLNNSYANIRSNSTQRIQVSHSPIRNFPKSPIKPQLLIPKFYQKSIKINKKRNFSNILEKPINFQYESFFSKNIKENTYCFNPNKTVIYNNYELQKFQINNKEYIGFSNKYRPLKNSKSETMFKKPIKLNKSYDFSKKNEDEFQIIKNQRKNVKITIKKIRTNPNHIFKNSFNITTMLPVNNKMTKIYIGNSNKISVNSFELQDAKLSKILYEFIDNYSAAFSCGEKTLVGNLKYMKNTYSHLFSFFITGILSVS